MPTRNISLTPEQDAFVDTIVDAGEYQNASEAMRDALRALQQRRREDAMKLQVLGAQIKLGVAALDAGDATDIEGTDVETYLTSLTTPPRRSRRKRAR